MRPAGLTALSVFFAAGAVLAWTSSVSLAFPGSPLEPLWSVNPHARDVLARFGAWAVVLMALVGAACAASAIGVWIGARWGRWLALGMLGANLIGDVLNGVLGAEPRAIVGVPIAGALLIYLATARVRRFFAHGAAKSVRHKPYDKS